MNEEKLPIRYCKHCGHKLESHGTGYICTYKPCTYYDYDLVPRQGQTMEEFIEERTSKDKNIS